MTDTDLKTRPTDEAADRPAYAKIRQMNRGGYDRDVAYEILDKGMIAHVGFIADERPMVIPMIYGRVGDTLYIHGASKTRIIKNVGETAPLTFTVTLIDGFVVSRATFHNSMNYRCAIAHGTARHVTDDAELEQSLAAMTDHLLPGRWAESRPMLDKEKKATGVLAMEIEHIATKVRTGPPGEDAEDLDLPIWGGVLPITTTLGPAISDAHVRKDVKQPASLQAARLKFL